MPLSTIVPLSLEALMPPSPVVIGDTGGLWTGSSDPHSSVNLPSWPATPEGHASPWCKKVQEASHVVSTNNDAICTAILDAHQDPASGWQPSLRYCESDVAGCDNLFGSQFVGSIVDATEKSGCGKAHGGGEAPAWRPTLRHKYYW